MPYRKGEKRKAPPPTLEREAAKRKVANAGARKMRVQAMRGQELARHRQIGDLKQQYASLAGQSGWNHPTTSARRKQVLTQIEGALSGALASNPMLQVMSGLAFNWAKSKV